MGRRNVSNASRDQRFYTHRHERGISLLYVVLSIFALLGMAALAIDLVTLYVARAQTQRVADAAALAGAKALIEQGLTADPTNSRASWATSCDQAKARATAIGNSGTIGGVAPASVLPCFPSGGGCASTCPVPGAIGTGYGVNPQVSVTVRSAPQPLFLSKIWGQPTAGISATALAEGFNPSGTDTPIAAKCVTPWMLPNMDPLNGSAPIFDKTTGAMSNNVPRVGGGPGGFVGETINLKLACPVGGCSAPTIPVVAGSTLSYYALDLPNPPSSLPNCSLASTYHQNIAACNATPLACGQTVDLDTTGNTTSALSNQNAIDCRIGATAPGAGNGQDTFDTTAFPYEIDAGTTHNGVMNGLQISTSPSLVTIPVYDSGAGAAPATTAVTVIGFVQAFVSSSDPTTGEPTIKIVNVAGCSSVGRSSAVPPVGINESSPVPVRLIHQ